MWTPQHTQIIFIEHDVISKNIVEKFFTYLIKSPVLIVNICLSTGIFLTISREAFVIPVHKSKDKTG